jgi:hypothetical protein
MTNSKEDYSVKQTEDLAGARNLEKFLNTFCIANPGKPISEEKIMDYINSIMQSNEYSPNQ